MTAILFGLHMRYVRSGDKGMPFIIKHGRLDAIETVFEQTAELAVDTAEVLLIAGGTNLTIQERRGGEKYSLRRFKQKQDRTLKRNSDVR